MHQINHGPTSRRSQLMTIIGLIVIIGTMLTALPGRPALAAEQLLVSDPLNGRTIGRTIGRGGEFVAGGGWRSSGATIVFDAGQQVTNGFFEATMRGYTVPAQGASKSHPLSCWENNNTFTHGSEPGAYWNWRIGTNYEVFKVLASYQGIDALPNDPFPRKEARVGSPSLVNDGRPHVYRVEWSAGSVSFLIDGTLLKRFDLPRFSVRYCTIGIDRWYPATNPAPIISNVRIVTRGGTASPTATRTATAPATTATRTTTPVVTATRTATPVVATATRTATVPAATATRTATPAPPTATAPAGPVTIGNLSVRDTANAAAWSVQANLQVGNQSYGDRRDLFTDVPALVAGASWIRPANASKTATVSPLVSFSISREADVYIAYDNRVPLPSWMAGWVDTGADLLNTTTSYSLYRRRLAAGTVSLGPLGGSGFDRSIYIVIVK